MQIPGFLRIGLLTPVAALAMAACVPLKEGPPDPSACRPDPAQFGAAALGTVDVNGDGTDEVWVQTDPGAYPQTLMLYGATPDCEYVAVQHDGVPVGIAVIVSPNDAWGADCVDIDQNGYLDFLRVRHATSTDGGATYQLEETDYAVTGTALQYIQTSTSTIPGGASIIGDVGSFSCGSLAYP